MGKYLVTTDDELRIRIAHLDYLVLSSLHELLTYELYDDDLIIIHKPNDETLHLGMAFTKLKETEGLQVFYIVDESTPAIEVLAQSAGCTVVNDTYFIEHPEELAYLEDEIEERGLVALEAQKEVQAHFTTLTAIASIVAETKDAGLNTVTTRALRQLEADYHLEVEKRNDVEQHFLQVVKGTDFWIRDAEAEKQRLEKMLVRVQEQLNNMGSFNSSPHQSDFNFPAYVYQSKAPIIIFKEYSHTRYLTSFVLGFQEWLEKKGKTTRVLILDQPGYTQQGRYDGIPFITRATYTNANVRQSPVGVVTQPFKDVMDYMCNLADKVVIVIDRMYRKEDFISGFRNRFKYHAFSGAGEYKRIAPNADGLHCLIPIVGNRNGSWTCLKHINNYPKEAVARVGQYHREHNTTYQRMFQEFMHLV